ncbi:MAG: carbonic anhydrase [Pseudohongiellaceae bacterium]|jgi:carbonic anhydrase
MMKTQTQQSLEGLTPATALDLLKKGNGRFQENLTKNRDLLGQVNSTSTGQFPFAIVLSCIDSRTSAELIFDQGLGDLFSARIAGNVLNSDILGSMEFACKLAGSKLIVVMGHSACGAVRGACDGAKLGNLSGLLDKIQPAIEAAKQGDDLSGDEFIQRVAEKNVDLVLQDIRKGSEVLDSMISSGEVGLIGAMYSVKTGQVSFQELQER